MNHSYCIVSLCVCVCLHDISRKDCTFKHDCCFYLQIHIFRYTHTIDNVFIWVFPVFRVLFSIELRKIIRLDVDFFYYRRLRHRRCCRLRHRIAIVTCIVSTSDAFCLCSTFMYGIIILVSLHKSDRLYTVPSCNDLSTSEDTHRERETPKPWRSIKSENESGKKGFWSTLETNTS